MINLRPEFYYLATAYSHPDQTVRARRARIARRYATDLLLAGYNTFSPIAYTHDMAEERDLPKDAETWRVFNEAYMTASCGIIVAVMEGWKQSIGVRDEVTWAKEHNKPLYLSAYDYDDNIILVQRSNLL